MHIPNSHGFTSLKLNLKCIQLFIISKHKLNFVLIANYKPLEQIGVENFVLSLHHFTFLEMCINPHALITLKKWGHKMET